MARFSRDSWSRVSEDVHRVEVPEHVEIGFTLAGFGSRFIAYLIDLSIMFIIVAFLFGAMLAIFILLQQRMYEQFVENPSPSMEGALYALLISLFGLALFIVSWFYFLLFEMLWDGRSPGKRAVGIRVIRDEGSKISFTTSLLRNLMRVADWLPAFYLVGIVAMFVGRKWKRLGDIVAGTIVVKEEKVQWVPARSIPPPPPGQRPEGIGAGIFTTEVCDKLGKEYYNLCYDYLKRRVAIDPKRAFEIAGSIAGPVMEKLAISDMSPDSFIETFVEAWQSKRRVQ